MKVSVTGVGGQLGHDCVNELAKRGHENICSDIQSVYSGTADGSAVTKASYRQLDITDKKALDKTIAEIRPDAIIHCAEYSEAVESGYITRLATWRVNNICSIMLVFQSAS